MESFGQVGNLRWTTRLEAPVDRPRITAGFGDQQGDADAVELH
ncbi:hypothetical protein LAUMK4_03011 [Mycobacterium persicum]|uniref:Uncharacterized protein n=1 Tax=Mycobacterium persicum TaxID=1487726 RepID=A0ABY6RJP0_9MYCO|nr:hypothetical protein LAUMK15_03337 [Mycobacterium persicum]VAZ95042.1 hypothetical protein LAUMK4_03011 [Mycobacterium persicum]